MEQVTEGSQVTQFTFDGADRLAQVTLPNGTVASYAYDHAGRRVKQQVNGTPTTSYLWDEFSTYGDVVLESNGSGTPVVSYELAGGQLLSQTRGGAVSYYLPDGQGSTRALANASGAVTDTYNYDAFGEVSTSSGTTANNYLYTGAVRLADGTVQPAGAVLQPGAGSVLEPGYSGGAVRRPDGVEPLRLYGQ